MSTLPIAFLPLISAFLAFLAIALSVLILSRVFEEKYRRPWLYIGLASVFFAMSHILNFANSYYGFVIFDNFITEIGVFLLTFTAMSVLCYGLLLEYFILKLYKGKFVKMKFIPVQEGSWKGDFDLNLNPGISYLSYGSSREEVMGEFSKATRKGYEGFLISEKNPRDIRLQYGLSKTAIGWLFQNEPPHSEDYFREFLDENSDLIEPMKLNSMINYIETFLEQSSNPFVLIEGDELFRLNNFSVVLEFLKYINSRINKTNAILIVSLRKGSLSNEQFAEISEILKILE